MKVWITPVSELLVKYKHENNWTPVRSIGHDSMLINMLIFHEVTEKFTRRENENITTIVINIYRINGLFSCLQFSMSQFCIEQSNSMPCCSKAMSLRKMHFLAKIFVDYYGILWHPYYKDHFVYISVEWRTISYSIKLFGFCLVFLLAYMIYLEFKLVWLKA